MLEQFITLLMNVNVTVAYVTIANVTRLPLTVTLAYRKFAHN